ncbi:MAG: class I SAM-dependent methyltransferase [Candidatus Woesebacteria bacterium]|jgi:predicted O-methyltransferase YrrM
MIKQLLKQIRYKFFVKSAVFQNPSVIRAESWLMKQNVYFRPSFIIEPDFNKSQVTKQLFSLAQKAIATLGKVSVSEVARRTKSRRAKANIEAIPGDHYFLLAALVKILRPKLVVEIGTATGASALCMKKYLPRDGKIITYDVVPWEKYPDAILRKKDFDEQLEQRVLDLTNPSIQESERRILENANFIFLDAEKDYEMEAKFIKLLKKTKFKNKPFVFFDDIRFMEMLEFWRSIKHPKIDLSSFGHWSGSGLVQWF